jgi:DMSO/TMAO reductase YedYZ molybdopterin-dependent catalytic subunit
VEGANDVNKDPELTDWLATEPLTLETRVSGLRLDPTPAAAVYIRNNLSAPDEAGEAWSVELSGTAVSTNLTLGDIFGGLPRHEMTAVLQCAGNGRRRLPQPAPGVQWDLGGMACVEWSGVRLADLAAAHGGAVDDLPYLTVLGGDAEPTDPARVERSVPAEAARADGLLADRMNGEPIPDIHGAPIRFVMPGYYAVNSVKWVRRVAFTDKQTDADIQAVRYRIVPPGEEPKPEHQSLWAMGPMSHIIDVRPEGDDLLVTGVAFSGGDPVEGVEITSDGETWLPATLGGDRGRFAWRRFEGAVPAGAEWVAARCQTAAGVQPRHSVVNREGNAVDGWQDLAFETGI